MDIPEALPFFVNSSPGGNRNQHFKSGFVATPKLKDLLIEEYWNAIYSWLIYK
jgi:hypothetical protein